MSSKKMLLLLPVLAGFVLFSCQKDSDPAQGTVNVEMTDAPVDDANVKAVFVTIADLKVDGASLEGFSKTTFEISAYQEGLTKLLCNTDLDAKAYSQIEVVLDFEADASGNAPGCYVVDTSGLKHKLASGASKITLGHDFTVEAGQQTNLVIDFDLRKCIAKEEGGADDYDFVTTAELEAGLRVVAEEQCGVIKGSLSDLLTNSDKIVVYAYKKGTFDKSAEVSGQGQSEVQFSKAETSVAVGADGEFELHFLEAGDYEVHFASYKENASGEMELKGTLAVEVLNSLNLGSLAVGASASVEIDILVTGLLPL